MEDFWTTIAEKTLPKHTVYSKRFTMFIGSRDYDSDILLNVIFCTDNIHENYSKFISYIKDLELKQDTDLKRRRNPMNATI